MADELPLGTCYGPGSIVGAIIGTLLITLALVAAAGLVYNIYWRSRKGKHLVLVTDVENPSEQYAFDNPNFREATPIKQSPSDEKTGKLDLSWLSGWSPLHVFSTPRNEKRTLDDSFLTDSQLKVVSLKSHDFTGLGFSVCGNMRDGIFVKDLLHRGPAFESGSMNPGDRIDSVCISFRHMVFEDALTILSYASPYEVQIQVEHNGTSRPSTLLRKRETNPATERILHPFYRSQSISDLSTIGKTSGRRSNTKKRGDASDMCATLKLPSEVKKEHQSLERRSVDMPDGPEPPKHAKFGIKVLPLPLRSREQNEQNMVIESELEEGKDVKAMLTKGLQNLKEKINQNTLGRKKKEEEGGGGGGIPEEVARAAVVAQNNRKSVSAESLAARKSAADILPVQETPETASKKTKGKAPAPPQQPVEVVFEPDSDSETEGVETTTQATVHHSPVTEEPESSRKAASLGDLSRLEEDESLVCPLERAVSLDMDAAHGKKRKAPPPPPEDFPGKEPRLEGVNTFQRLKKSSDFGTLEDALPEDDYTSTVASNIQEFSSWLEEVRKPQTESETETDHLLTLQVNPEETGKNAWDISGDSDILYTSCLDPNEEQNEMETETLKSGVTFSVNGLNLNQEPSRTVLLISQPNSLDPEEITALPADPEDDTPPKLPTSPPPSTSLTYITEIRVTTPEPPRAKPQRKDVVSPDISRIPVRTMKSETGQKVLAAIQSLAREETPIPPPPSVAGFHLKKVPPVVPPRKSDVWPEKDRINGTPLPTGVSLPVKTSATKIVFESQENNEEF